MPVQYNGSYIMWQHIVALYHRDRGKATGLFLVKNLKFEHIRLSSFAKMRVDLAAQVLLKFRFIAILYSLILGSK